jgi:hypothetical protein
MFKKPQQSGPMMASDMPAGSPKPPPPTSITPADMMPARVRLPAVAAKSGWQPWFQSFVTAIVGVLLGAYLVNNSLTQKIQRDHRHELVMNSWNHLVSAGVEVDFDRNKVSADGQLTYTGLHFYNVNTLGELRKAVIFSTLMPGITELDFRPKGDITVGCGVADDTVMQLVAKNYGALNVLDLTGTKVENLRTLLGMKIQHLKVTNLPILPDQFEWLAQMDSISELWIGWPDRSLPKDSRYLSPVYKTKLLENLKKMKGLKVLHLHAMELTPKEQEQLGGIRVVPSYLTN